MIATALALQNATKDAVHDDMVMAMATALFSGKDTMTDEEFAESLYKYSAMLASMTTTLVTNTLLTESQIGDLISTINEMESMGKDLDNGN